MTIRKAQTSNYQKIYDLVKNAFETAQVSDGTEQDFVERLRSGKNFIPDLEFIAEEQHELVGHIMMTKQQIQTETGIFTEVLIAPLCVALPYRGQGIGGALINYAEEQAVCMGYTASFLVGNPDYYGRFGYQQAAHFGIQNITDMPDHVILARELTLGALNNVHGTIEFPH